MCAIKYNLNFTTLLICFSSFIMTSSANDIQNCEPLSLQDGELICSPAGSASANTCEEAQEIETIATYKCKPYFVSYETYSSNYTSKPRSGSSQLDTKDQVLKCGQNGQWIGYNKFKNYGCREDCGSKVANAKPLIINGVATNTSSWPWHTAIFKKAQNSLHYICGGTIIQKSVILTAAHCVSISPVVQLDPESFVVVLGAQSIIFDNNTNIPEAQIFGVTKIFVSESYDAKKEFQADIAILQLNGTIQYSEAVSPVCLPNDFVSDLNAIKPGRLGDVVGFGVDENNKLSQILKHAKLEIKSHSECYAQLERTLTESQFCAGNIQGEKWVTVCNGDSGGSLVQPSLTQEKYFIHGIVSTGDAKVRVGVCQNEAVFTRVFSFIGWIQNVLEEIGGNLTLEFDSNYGIPYVLKGKEYSKVEFIPIPIEWKNRVNSIELTNVDVDPEVLLDSLEYSKTIQRIHFTRVNFTKRFSKRRVRLPHLKSISMDILREDANISASRTVPLALRNNYLGSLIFFDQDIEDDNAEFNSRIAKLKIDIQITVHIFKLLDISQDSGKISLSQSAHANEVLINRLHTETESSPEFTLKHLALSRCSLNTTVAELLSQQSEIESLVLDQVDLDLKGQNIGSILRRFDQLQELVFEAPSTQNISINAYEIPNGLNHLALSGTILTFELDFKQYSSAQPVPFHPTAILFPDFSANVENYRRNISADPDPSIVTVTVRKTSKLRSLYCDSCLPLGAGVSIESSLRNLQLIFPELKELVIVAHVPMPNMNLLDLLSSFKKLESAFLKLNDQYIRFSKQDGRLVQSEWKEMEMDMHFEFEHLDWVMNRRGNFWTSEGDYISLTRLSSAETIGFETGHYKFDSGVYPLSSGYFDSTPEVLFHIVPPKVQERLESMEISNVEFKIRDIVDTTKFCSRLKRVSFVNVSSLLTNLEDVPENAELPMLEEYYGRATFTDAWTVLGYHRLKLSSENFFQYIVFWRGEVESFDPKKNLLESRVKKIHLQHGDCVGITWNANEGRLVSAMNHTHEWFKSANKNPEVHVRSFAFKYWELDPSVVPPSIKEINLNFVVLKNNNVPKLFERLTTLKSMTFVNVRASDNNPSDFKTWVWPEINITHLADQHSKTLEYMVFEKVHFKGYTTSVVFGKVKSAYFESCKFEPSFLRNFVSVFPNLTRLVIAGGSRVDGYILLHAAQLPSIQWILTTRAGVGSHVLREKLKHLLGGQPLKGEDGSIYFLIEKINKTWTQVDIIDKLIKSQMNEMKGVKVFGTEPRCHALSFVGGVLKDIHLKLP